MMRLATPTTANSLQGAHPSRARAPLIFDRESLLSPHLNDYPCAGLDSAPPVRHITDRSMNCDPQRPQVGGMVDGLVCGSVLFVM